MPNTFLVTGAMGCLGAWTISELFKQGASVVGFDLSTDLSRLKLLLNDEEIAQLTLARGDITDFASVERTVIEHGITRIIHLAALQVPFCQADPVRGAQVNVVGTVNVFEAAARHRDQVQRVVYASSVAVLGPANLYGSTPVNEQAPTSPATHYGVFKQTNEGTARIYFQDKGVSSIGLRPYVIYGLGRDRGLTASPTKAMLAAVLGRAYEITYGSRCNFQFARDVAQTFIACATVPSKGAQVFHLGGSKVSVAEVITAIEKVLPECQGRISYKPERLPFPGELDDRALKDFLPQVPETSLEAGVRATINAFRELVAQRRIDVDNAMA